MATTARSARLCPICGCLPLQWLRPQTVATTLQVDVRTIINMVHDGRLAGMRVGRSWRVSHASLDAYCQSHASLGEESEQ